jgi:hypothetical protein
LKWNKQKSNKTDDPISADTFYSCPLCGSTSEIKIKRCQCGFIYRPNWTAQKSYISLIVIVFILASVAASVVTYNAGYNDGVSAQKEINDRSAYASGFDASVKIRDTDVQNLERLVKERGQKIADMWPEYMFMRNNAAIVTVISPLPSLVNPHELISEYHHYGCSHIADKRVYIYNKNRADADGFTPCPDCWDSGLLSTLNYREWINLTR